MSAEQKKRLDQLLVEKKLAKTKSQASRLIKEGFVKINSKKELKPGAKYSNQIEIQLTAEKNFVGMGARKLEKAVKVFKINPKNKICIDVGASTGGFTDCLLQYGAKKIYAVEIGHSQLAEKLINDSKVVNLEQTDIRELKKLPEKPKLAVVDLSYISLKKIITKLIKLLDETYDLIVLFKPQFEAGPKAVNKKGIILEEKLRAEKIN